MPRLGLNNDGDQPRFCWLFKLTHYRFAQRSGERQRLGADEARCMNFLFFLNSDFLCVYSQILPLLGIRVEERGLPAWPCSGTKRVHWLGAIKSIWAGIFVICNICISD
jgi:hypothetical protein